MEGTVVSERVFPARGPDPRKTCLRGESQIMARRPFGLQNNEDSVEVDSGRASCVMRACALFRPSDERATLRLRRNYGAEPERQRARRSGVERCGQRAARALLAFKNSARVRNSARVQQSVFDQDPCSFRCQRPPVQRARVRGKGRRLRRASSFVGSWRSVKVTLLT